MLFKVFFMIIVNLVFFSSFATYAETKIVDVSQIIQFIYDNNCAALEKTLKDGLSPNAKSGKSTFIHLAVVANKIDVVKLFISYKANLKEEGNGELVNAAIANQNKEMMKLLVENGAYINKPPFAGPLWRSPLINAVLLDDIESVEYLIANGADVNAIDGLSLRTPIQWAAADGYIEIMQLLKNAGGIITNRDEDGCTALMLAAKRGSEQAVKMLVSWGADINERDNDGKTALMHACENGHLQIVELLLLHGADPSIKAAGGIDARSYAGEYLINRLLKEIDKSELEKCKNDAEVKEVLMRHISKEDEALLIKCSGNNKNAGLTFN